ncbi:dynein axonemal light chain 4-like [Corythoichthys intestinalis]|uniref:dynein axonemal light chain 4-like n=1 Tax=Corythoichthys intestinalis TaxID=161448 RepID=UPI0025A57C0C|nr:dynein axonemal light chain 4-like [Corythoichthys intestinalis]XP_061797423.1 dynein axonemal light chain 4-like [Nerophis lumbriciformis]
MAETGETDPEEGGKKLAYSFPIVRHTDMPEEMKEEAIAMCIAAFEKCSNNNENAAKMVKDSMDKRFGNAWHVVIGESFGFGVTHEAKNMLYMFYGGSLAICVWKCF